MSKRSTASRFTLFVIILIAVAGFTALAAQYQMLPSGALLTPRGAHRAMPQEAAAPPVDEEGQPPRVRITQPIDENVRVTLGSNTRPEARNAANDRGAVYDSLSLDHMLFQLQRSPEKEQEFQRVIDDLNDKTSANFHHWLTADEIGQRFGVADEDVKTVTGWLESHGFRVNQVYPATMMIDFSGTAGQVKQAFHTEIHNLSVNGESHIANISDPQIPAALAPVVAGPVSLNDFKPHPMYKSRPDYSFAGCTSATGTGTCYSLTAGDTETIYNLNPVFAAGYSGQGQTIAVVEDSDTYNGSGAGSDWATYRTTFGLASAYPAGSYTQLHPGGCTDPGANAADGEAAIDVEMATTVAPSASVELISCADGTVTFGGLLALQNLVNGSGPYPGVVSVSYGIAETVNGNGGNQAFYNTYQAAAGEGITVFGSSGDGGPSALESGFEASFAADGVLASLSITGWAETPYNVAVGGTDFEDVYDSKEINTLGGQSSTVPLSAYWNATNSPTYGSARSYIPEIPWNDACASVLIAEYVNGSFTTYGTSGFCNQSTGDSTSNYMSEAGAAGGASNCALTGWDGSTTYLTGVVAPDCQGYPKPAFQSGSSLTGGLAVYGQPSDGVRDIPDVSMFASNGVWSHFQTVCWSDPSQTAGGSAPCTGTPSTWSGFGGTSVSSPTMAGIQALVNQKTGENWGIGALKNYYQIGQTEYGTAGGTFQGASCNSSVAGGPASGCVWNDVTQGDIGQACQGNSTTAQCYNWNSANRTNWGVTSTDVITAATVLWGGSGYTSVPSCAIAGPSNNNPYKAPSGTTLWSGGTLASCTAAVTATSTNAVWTVKPENSSSGFDSGQQIVVSGPTGGSPTTYTLPTCTSATTCGSDLVSLVTSTPNVWATASGTSTVTFTAKTAGAAGNFIVGTGTAAEFGGEAFQILNTTKGQGPNYVSGITITGGGSGYQPETPITLGGPGSGALAVANTSVTTAASTYQPAYGAAQGWDMATGLGSPNAYNLVCSSVWGSSCVTSQTITVTQAAPSTATYGTSFNVAATASSGLPVAITVDAGSSSVCSGSGSGSATITMTSGTGTCTVDFNQAGNGSYSAAPQVQSSATATLATPTTTFTGAPSSATYGTQFGVTSSTNASTSATITSSGACSGSGTNSATITMTSGTGTCAMMAHWAADTNYSAATMNQSTTAGLATPTVTFTGAPTSAAYGTQFGESSSTNASTVASITSDGVTCSGSGTGSAQITMISGTGTCTTTANWAADSNYAAASMNQTTTAQLANPTVTFTGAPTSEPYSGTFTVTATTNDGPGRHRPIGGGNPAAITASGACSVPGNSQNTALVTMTGGTGTCNLQATWQSDNNYNGATLYQSTTAQRATPTVTFIGAPGSAAYGSSFGVTSSTNSSTAAAISGDNVTCSGSGTAAATITMIAPTGTCTTTAVWQADSNYSGATAYQTTTATQAGTSTALTAVNYSLNPGQSTTLTATVTFAAAHTVPTGNVTFWLNGQALTPTETVSSCGNICTTVTATYTLQASQLNAGPNSLYAAYPGDANYSNSDSSASPITITLGSNNLSFGNVNVGSSASGMTVTYNFTANETLSDVRVDTGGALHKDFMNAGGGTCAKNTAYNTGDTCTVNVSFTPAAPGVRAGAVKLYAQGMTLPLATFFINGTGESAAVTVDPGTQTSLGSFVGVRLRGVALDGAGNVYVSNGNNAVTEIAAGTQTQTTVADFGMGGLNSSSGLAVDGAGNLYIADPLDNRVAVVPNEKGTLNAADLYTVGTGLATPNDVKVDGLGNVYIADSGHNRIVEVAANGTQTVPVTGILFQPGALAVDAAGDIYVAGSGVIEYPAGGGSPIQIGSGFQTPYSLALDASGTLYVADEVGGQVYAVTPGGVQTTVPVTGLTGPNGATLDGSGNVYIADQISALYEVNRTLPLALSFPTEMINNASPAQTVTVSNVGNQQLTASNLAIPTNFIQTPSGGTDCSGSTTLNSSLACQIAIEFDPTGTGSDSGNVTLTDNALNNPASTQSVSVSGNGSLDNPTVTFTGAPTSAAYNATFTVTATTNDTGNAGVITASGACSVPANSQNSALVTMTSGTGTCSLTATWTADSQYNGATLNQSTTAGLATPTTTFTGAPTSAAYGSQFTVASTTNASTTAVITSNGACSNVNTLVTMTSGTGTCGMTATWAADNNYTGATANQSTSASLATPTVTFTGAPTSAAYNATFTVTATTNDGPGRHRPVGGGNPAAITASGACTVPANSQNSALVTMTSGTGTCMLTATWQADNNYTGATLNQSTTATQATQGITFSQNAPGAATYNTSFNVAAAANSGLTVAFTASGVCGVVDHLNGTATYTITSGTGTCMVIANQAGNANYSPAQEVMENTRANLATPTTTFTGAPTSAAYGSQFTVASTTNASTTAVITSNGACSNVNTLVTMTSGTGTCGMTATWAADNNYSGATANQSTSASLATPTVTFTGAPTSAAYNSTFTVTATTNDGPGRHRPVGGGNPAAITASGSCSVPANSQNSALVTMTSGTGTCMLTATWQADNNYNGATLNQSTTATLATPTVTFTGAPTSAAYGSQFTVSSTTNSSTTAVITSNGACSNVNTLVTMTSGTGTCGMTATWAADNNYAAATANQSTAAQLATPTVTFTGAPTSAAYGSTFGVTTTTNDTGNPAAITASGACTVPANSQNSATVTMTSGTGTCALMATWAADNKYSGATKSQSTAASLATPTVTFTGAPTSAAYGSTFGVTTTTNDTGNPAAITASGACTVPANSQNSATVTMTSGTGTCALMATWASDNNYSGATKNQSTAATKTTPTVTFTGAPATAAYKTSFTVNSTTNASTSASIGVSGVCSITSGGTTSATVQMTSGTGSCTLTATWAADNNYNSATAMQSTTATKALTHTPFSTSPNPSTKGQKVTFAATVKGPSGDGVPTGTITFQNTKGTKYKVEAVSPAGGASFSISTLKQGSTAVEAVYSGDSNFAGSTSPVVDQVVNP